MIVFLFPMGLKENRALYSTSSRAGSIGEKADPGAVQRINEIITARRGFSLYQPPDYPVHHGPSGFGKMPAAFRSLQKTLDFQIAQAIFKHRPRLFPR